MSTRKLTVRVDAEMYAAIAEIAERQGRKIGKKTVGFAGIVRAALRPYIAKNRRHERE